MNDRSYAKLFSGIVTSSMWNEDLATRVVWITILASKNEHGEVFATVSALARLANVTLDQARAAIEKCLSPDPESRTKDNDGRRLVEIGGGWRVLNNELYKRMASREERKEYQSRKYEERKSRNSNSSTLVNTCQHSSTLVNTCQHSSTLSRQAEEEAEEKTEAEEETYVSVSASSLSLQQAEAENIYSHYPRKEARQVAIKAILSAQKKCGSVFLLDRVKAYAAAVALWPDGDKKFVPHPATWFNQGRYDDDPATWVREGSAKPKTLRQEDLI